MAQAETRLASIMKELFKELAELEESLEGLLAARAHNRQHALRLRAVGADYIIRDTLLSSIFLAGEVLKDVGLSPEQADAATSFFLKHDTETLNKQYAIHQDEDALIQSARDASEELRDLFDSDAKI